MAVAEDKIQGFSGDLAIAELLVKPLKDHDLGTVQKVKALFDAKLGYFTALAHDREVFELAAQLRATQRLGMADAIHAATAIKHGCAYFLSFDAKLARNTLGVEVIDIAQWLD